MKEKPSLLTVDLLSDCDTLLVSVSVAVFPVIVIVADHSDSSDAVFVACFHSATPITVLVREHHQAAAAATDAQAPSPIHPAAQAAAVTLSVGHDLPPLCRVCREVCRR